MFHSLGNQDSDWCQNWLSVSLDHFDRFCRFLVDKQFRTSKLDEWYEREDAGHHDNKTVYLTFDDGYLDNWVYAYPILKKYGLKGTVFVNPEFVDPSSSLRPTLEDVWQKRVPAGQLSALGFLNWDEIRYMDKSGILDIQSHSMSHNYYFSSDRILCLFEGQPEYHWMPWISHPERKHLWLTEDQGHLVEHGHPVFEYDRALGIRRYLPDERIIHKGIELYGDRSVAPGELTALLDRELKLFPGRYETDKEMISRFRYEIIDSKSILEEQLSKQVNFLCWPGGGYREESLSIAREAGYKASTLASRERPLPLNNSGTYKRIRRFGLSAVITGKKGYHYQKNRKWLIYVFHSGRGHIFYKYRIVLHQKLILLLERFNRISKIA